MSFFRRGAAKTKKENQALSQSVMVGDPNGINGGDLNLLAYVASLDG